MAKIRDGQIVETDLPFPIEGVDEQRSYSRQRQGTAPDVLNMRAFDQKNDRARGAVRPGLAKVYYENFDGTSVTDFSVQDINQLTTVLPAPTPSGDFQQFTYAQASGSGFSIGDGRDGANIGTMGAASGYAMACSCWDSDGIAYVAMVKIGDNPAPCVIYKVASPWTSATIISNNQFSVATGSLRNVAGMCVVKISSTKKYLFVAVKPPSGTAYIWRLNAVTGALVDGTFPFTAHNTNLQNLTFSTAAQNCLSSAGNVLAVESVGSGTNQGLRTYNADYATITQDVSAIGASGTIPAFLNYLAWGGTGANTAVKVVSDGNNFYCIASVTALKLKKVSSGGVLLQENTTSYQTAAAGVPLALDIDTRNSKLVLASDTAPYIRLVSTSDITATPTTGSPGSAAQWDEVASDGNGTFMLWRNAAANNFMTVDTSVTAVLAMGAFDIANGTQYGASVNKGLGSAPPLPGAGVTTLVSLMVKQGKVYTFDGNGPNLVFNGNVSGDTLGNCFNGTEPQIFSAQNGPNMFYADGSVYRYYKGSTRKTLLWTLTDGTLPVDDNGKPSRLICLWDGRIVLVIARNFYMSTQFDPFNFNYSPSVVTAASAFRGNPDVAGELGDLITCIAPMSDDAMVFGCDHSLYVLRGNPMAGGVMSRVSEGLGIAFGRPYAFDPQNGFYFFGSDQAIYKMSGPDSIPVPISKQIRRRLQDIDMSKVRIVMAWDQYQDGLGVWVTPLDEGLETENYFWERRVEGWWPDYYGHPKMNPMVAFAYDGDTAQDRQIYLGGRDGYIRRFAADQGDDDGTLIESYVILGPIKTDGFDNIIHRTLQATLGDNSGEVRYDLYWGEHPEQALAAALAGESKIHGIWTANRNRLVPTDREGFAFYLKLSSTDYWAMEKITQTFKTTGLVRRRQ